MCMDGFMFGSCCVHDTADNMISHQQQQLTTSKVRHITQKIKEEVFSTVDFFLIHLLKLNSNLSEIPGHHHQYNSSSHQEEDNISTVYECFIQQRLLSTTETAPKVWIYLKDFL